MALAIYKAGQAVWTRGLSAAGAGLIVVTGVRWLWDQTGISGAHRIYIQTGIALGILLAKVISAATSMPSSVEPLSVVLAIFMATSLGLFFGIYPANKAAKLDPVDALRSEQ
jgi:ABC-type lipoprotein release transport system permease subunit